ncbi:MAG: AI-2E family transporter [Lachnospiraceae bacterium]|nr:AI-2E family transporter [Lachnospiraceae bacterium]
MKWKPKTIYGKIAVTGFVTFAACILFYFLLFRVSSIAAGLRGIGKVLAPVVYGFAIAYLLDPFMMLIERLLLKICGHNHRELSKRTRNVIRFISSIGVVIILILIIYGVISRIVPELVQSIKGIIDNLPTYFDQANKLLSQLFSGSGFLNNTFGETAADTAVDYVSQIFDFLNENLGPGIDGLVSEVTTHVVGIVGFIANMVLGLIVSVYVLIYKNRIKARFKRLVYAVFSITAANMIVHNLRFVDKKFGGFIIGKLIDSLIIGIICYVAMSILHMPYPMLIAIVIGLTNIIPFFGPLIGAIPSAILILFVDPLMALYFIILIIVLQQFDGNFLGPKILGNSVGVSSFLVLISILIGSGILGMVGMIIAVPLCAIIFAIIQTYVIKSTLKKDLPSDLESYRTMWEMDPTTHKPVTDRPIDGKMGLYDKLKHFGKKYENKLNPAEETVWDQTEESVRALMEKRKISLQAEEAWRHVDALHEAEQAQAEAEQIRSEVEEAHAEMEAQQRLEEANAGTDTEASDESAVSDDTPEF